MELQTLKCSTIYVATAGATRVYRSAGGIPSDLRKSLAGNSPYMQIATLLIADRNGQKELERAIQGLPSRVGFRRVHAAGGERGNWKSASIDASLLAALVLLAWLLGISK